MKTKSNWKFSAALEDVDVPRILREALESTPDAKCVRFVVDGHVFTAVKKGLIPEQEVYLRSSTHVQKLFRDRQNNIDILLTGDVTNPGEVWYLFAEDMVKKACDRVETTVEVF